MDGLTLKTPCLPITVLSRAWWTLTNSAKASRMVCCGCDTHLQRHRRFASICSTCSIEADSVAAMSTIHVSTDSFSEVRKKSSIGKLAQLRSARIRSSVPLCYAVEA